MVVADGQSLPLGNYLDSASPAEVGLIEPTTRLIKREFGLSGLQSEWLLAF